MTVPLKEMLEAGEKFDMIITIGPLIMMKFVTLTAKPICGSAEIAPVAKRMILDFYSRCLRPGQLEKMLELNE